MLRAVAILFITSLLFAPAYGQFGFKKDMLKDKVKKPDMNVKQAAVFKAAEAKLKKATKMTNKKCKLKISPSLDKESFKSLTGGDLDSLKGAACEEALVAVQSICRKKTFRKKLRKVKKYTCQLSNGQVKLKMQEGDHLVAMVKPTEVNVDKFKVDIQSFFASKKK